MKFLDNFASKATKRDIKAIYIWAVIATLIASTLAGMMFNQHCQAKYENWIKERAICLEQAQYYENAWCDDNNNLVK